MNIDAMEVKFKLRGLLMKWFNEGKESHGKMAIPIYPSSMINRDVDSFLEQFKAEQKQSAEATTKALQRISQYSDSGSYEKAIIEMKSIASDALKATIPTPVTTANKYTPEVEGIIEDLLEYFHDRQDGDHDGEYYVPNQEMKLYSKTERLKELLNIKQ